jgi:hypothetical protein
MGKIRSAVGKEAREALPALVFFLVTFHMVSVTKAVILEDYHVSGAGAALATVGAMIVAKVILVLEHLPVSRLFLARPLWNVAWKTVLFAAVTTLFRVIEEMVPIVLRHGSVGEGARRLASEVSWPRFWVVQMWLFAFLFLYNLAAALVRIIGAGRVREMLLRGAGAP